MVVLLVKTNQREVLFVKIYFSGGILISWVDAGRHFHQQ